MKDVRVRTWEAWVEGHPDTLMEREALFPVTVATIVARRFVGLGEPETVLVREKGSVEKPRAIRVEAYVEFLCTDLHVN